MLQVRRALYLQTAGLILATLFVAWIVATFPVLEYVSHVQRKIGEMEVWGGVLYPLFYAACNVLLLPGGVLAIGSGFFFGLWWGFFLNLVGNVTAAAVAFFISRKLGRHWVEKKFSRHRKWAALDVAIARDGWRIIFLSQLHPLFPTSLLNYLYGVTRIPFRTCVLWIALGQAPGLFLYAYLGTLAQLGIRLWRGTTDPRLQEYMLWIGGLVLTLAVTVGLSRLALRLLAEAEQAANQAPKLPTPPPALAPARMEDAF
jgi:uncharacterized membrane protein YdjX (TVP38/TMEM64 family)